MAGVLFVFLILYNVLLSSCKLDGVKDDVNPSSNYVYWPNATIPFFINPDHFDSEQFQSILSSLSLFAFKTCLKFNPVMAEPVDHHVLVIENPNGRRKCDINTEAHSLGEPHRITLGYECLKPPHVDALIMRALGFPFEHNRASRDVFIDVQFENIQPGYMDLFTKDKKLPPELRVLPYDVNSVTHFSERDFSKNGHKTIIFKDRNTKQNRIGLSPTDIRKIEIVYGDECRKRDRQAKIDLCKRYPGVVRKKRDLENSRSLRVNPDITPPPENVTLVSESIKELGIVNEVEGIIQDIYKLTALALNNARQKYCNASKEILRTDRKAAVDNSKPDIFGIIELITEYTKNIVDDAMGNLTQFCLESETVDGFFRSRCGWYDSNNNRCPQYFKSTKSGRVKYSTQHRPVYHQSTKHKGRAVVYNYDPSGLRTGNANGTDNKNDRQKRSVASEATEATVKIDATDDVKIQTDGNNSKDVLRMATTVRGQKGVNYAPIMRRNVKRYRIRTTESNIDMQDEPQSIVRKKHKKISYDQSGTVDDRVVEDIGNGNGRERPRKRLHKIRRESALPKIVKLSKENKEFYKERKWPERIVRYIITEDPRYDIQDMRDRLAAVGDILKNKTCVRIQEITEDQAESFSDYLVLDTSPDYVTGRVGGRQNFGVLELFRGGQHRQHAAMMVMAMLGFYFEVSRHDRDRYIRVHNRHIRPDKLHHFEKIREDATLPLPYDYASATHPAWQFWRKLGKKGISTVATYKDLDPDGGIMKMLGQHSELLSKHDLVKINSVYGIRCFRSQRRMKIRGDVFK
ncbi:uncharacterized protein LOC119838459 [Zerene cesonia]|uniref:uncharacterized protein LOC119838459 n=1 Tax=Zerene cesonia TaxID=33412 RepID=UPI0018E4EE4B|nr:uncharacterized protein LOC119838459 [Zerene cesonia]